MIKMPMLSTSLCSQEQEFLSLSQAARAELAAVSAQAREQEAANAQLQRAHEVQLHEMKQENAMFSEQASSRS